MIAIVVVLVDTGTSVAAGARPGQGREGETQGGDILNRIRRGREGEGRGGDGRLLTPISTI